MNRQEKRISKKAIHSSERRYKITRIPAQADLIDQEDDLGLWTETLEGYRKMAVAAQSRLRLGFIFRNGGIPDSIAKNWFYADSEELSTAAAHSIIDILSPNRTLFNSFRQEVTSSRNSGNIYTNDEYKELWQLIKDADISALDVLKELYRHTTSMKDLTKMHVDWLRAQKKVQKKQERKRSDIQVAGKTDLEDNPESLILNQIEVPTEQIPLETSQEIDSELSKEFLPGINLFWTTRPWESDEKYLKPIDTSSRLKAVTDISEEVRGFASIKPVSVANALEFYTRRDVMIQALAAGLKHVPEHVKNWARIKRGRDRIFLRDLNPNQDLDDRTVVFFVEGRDQVYRSLKR
jgi:hypothetical protein